MKRLISFILAASLIICAGLVSASAVTLYKYYVVLPEGMCLLKVDENGNPDYNDEMVSGYTSLTNKMEMNSEAGPYVVCKCDTGSKYYSGTGDGVKGTIKYYLYLTNDPSQVGYLEDSHTIVSTSVYFQFPDSVSDEFKTTPAETTTAAPETTTAAPETTTAAPETTTAAATTVPVVTDPATTAAQTGSVTVSVVTPRRMSIRLADGTVLKTGGTFKTNFGETVYFQMCSNNWTNDTYTDDGNGICGTVVYKVIVSADYTARSYDASSHTFVLPKGDTTLRTNTNTCFMAYRYSFYNGDYDKQTGIEQVIADPLESLSVNLPLGSTIFSTAFSGKNEIANDNVFVKTAANKNISWANYVWNY